MARNPGAQADNRCRELAARIPFAMSQLRNAGYDRLRAEDALEKARQTEKDAKYHLFKLQNIMIRLAEGGDGVFAWGLPRTIKIAEFKAIVPDADIEPGDEALEAAAEIHP